MADRTVSVRLQAVVSDYLTKMTAAGKATSDLAMKVDAARGRAAEGYRMIGTAGVAVGTAVAAGFAVAVKSMATFESKMALVRTLSHANAADMQQLHDAALTVGQAYGFSADEVADAEAELVKAGVSVKDVLGGALTGALTLAAAGQTDVAEATEIAATAMTQFQLAGKDVPHIADLLAAGADKALGSVGDLGYALDQAGPQAHQFGVSLEETVGTLAAFAQAGQIGERGGTIFSQMLIQLANPSKQAAGIMQQLGLSVYDTAGQFVGMANLAGQLQQTMGGLTQAERTHDLAVIFGQRAIRGANILYQEGAKGIEDWTKNVNDSGFAALQAAGKMDSLSGDATKLKTALQSAFIGVGEGANGPLRTLVQDVTKVVEVWNDLPGPVKRGTEAMVALGGAVSLAGGAAVLFIPKWVAMNAALKDTRIGAISATRALGGLGKLAVGGAVLFGVAEGIRAIDSALNGVHSQDVDDVTTALEKFLLTGKSSGALADAFGNDLSGLGDEIRRITDPSNWQRANDVMGTIAHFGGLLGSSHPQLDQAHKDFQGIDSALSSMVTSGNAKTAHDVFLRLSDAARSQGIRVKDLAGLLPEYGKALDASATSAKLAGNGVDQYGNDVGGAAKQTKTATDAAKNYAKELHALADPLFAMNSALSDLRDKQHALNKAIEEHGKDSRAARQAQLDLASSSLDVAAASRDLAASVKDGSTSLGDARDQLRSWVKAGILTKSQADAVIQSFGGLINRAQHVSRALHDAAGGTKDAGRAIGVDFGQGIVQGLDSKNGVVRAHAQMLASQLEKYSRLAIQAKSPSRVAIRVGEDWGAGLALGVASSAKLVAAATMTVTRALRRAVAPTVTDPSQLARILDVNTNAAINARQTAMLARQAYQELHDHAKALDDDAQAARRNANEADRAAEKAKRHADAMKDDTAAEKAAKNAAEDHAKALQQQAHDADQAAKTAEKAAAQADRAASKSKDAWQGMASAAQDAASKAADAAQALVQSLTDAVSQMAAEVADFEQQISSGIANGSSLSDVVQSLTGTDANGNPTTPTLAGVQTALDGILSSAEQFADDLNQLVSEGANQDLVTQLAGMGTTAGDALAQQLLAAGPDAVKALQSTMAQIRSVADAEGDLLATDFYGQGVSDLQKLVDGMLSDPAMKGLRKALHQIVNEIDDILGSANPTVTVAVASKTPKFAAGVTNFGGGIALVGERGPEYVTLPAGSSVYPNGTAPFLDVSGVEGRLDAVVGRLASLEQTVGALPREQQRLRRNG